MKEVKFDLDLYIPSKYILSRYIDIFDINSYQQIEPIVRNIPFLSDYK